MMEDVAERLDAFIGVEIDTLEQLGRAAYKLHLVDGTKLLVKLQPKCGSLLSRIVRFFCGGSLPFQNEFIINQLLSECQFSHLLFPRMKSGVRASYLVLEYVPCLDARRFLGGRLSYNSVFESLAEFSTAINQFHQGIFSNIVFSLLERPVYRVLRLTLGSPLTLRIKFNIAMLLLSHSIRQSSVASVLLHNDLSFSNLMIDFEGRAIFIDFEDSIIDSKWLLMDAIDILFDRDNLLIDINKVKEYWNILSKKLKLNSNVLDLYRQIHFCSIRHIINSINNQDFMDNERDRYICFLKETLLVSEKYERWYKKCSRL